MNSEEEPPKLLLLDPLLTPVNDTLALPLLQGVSIKKLYAVPSYEFIKSLKLRNFPEEKLRKSSKDIGAYIYFFKITQNTNSWIIRRPFKELLLLDKHIKCEAKSLKKKVKLPGIPFTKDKSQDPPSQNLNFFESYLKIVLAIPELLSFESLSLFFEISEVENENDSRKYKEIYVRKRAGGRYKENKLLLRCGAFWKCWNKRYLIITSEGVMYSRGHKKSQSFVLENLLFDHHFQLKYGKLETGLNRGLNLMYSNRKLHIEALDLFAFFDILASLIDAFENSPYIVQNRFKSFAPVRENSFCKYYIDGEDYFHDVCDALLSAQTEVFITDWWLSPEIYLKRPVSSTKNTYTRLDRILKNIAENGVMIKIVIYNEPKVALNIDSEHTQQSLQKLHANITVLRHPGYLLPTFLWSHHEKMIIIDQEVGFLGGLDLCYGRMDTIKHHLYDNLEENINNNGEISNESENEEFFPGIDYSNSRIKDFVSVRNYEKPLIGKKKVPRMPWHDIGVRIIGEAVADMSRHFIQYWNFVKFDLEPTVKKKKLFSKGVALKENKPNYLDRVKRKWTKFKRDLGLVPEDRDKGKKIDYENFDRIEQINEEEDQETKIEIVKNNKNHQNSENNEKNGKNEKKGKNIYKSDFLPKNHQITNNFYNIYAPKINDIEQKVEIQDNEEIIHNGLLYDEESKEIDLNDENYNENNDLERGKYTKKNSLKNRNFIKSNTIKPSENLFELPFPKRIRSISQNARNCIDNFENNPRFKLLLKEVQQAKIENSEKIEDDYMKTTKEIGVENKTDYIAINLKTTSETETKPSKTPLISSISPKKPLKTYEKWRSFFTRDKEEIEHYQHQNSKKREEFIQKEPLILKERFDSSPIALKSDMIKFHHGKKHYETTKIKCQMLRSASLWSLGLKRENYEDSIYIAYLALITNAENYIYIENQFFISSLAGAPVKNKIADALLERIKKAAADNQRFKVIILMPLLPGFEGEINGENSAVLKVQLHYEYLTLSRGGRSLYEELAKDPNISDPFEYLSVYGLRNHGIMPNNTPVTEIIYIHSKLMIIDDLFVITGSANINDRSLLGNRDSEIAMLIEDNNLIVGKMNGNLCKVSKFAQSLRIKLFTEHFGLNAIELEDPLNTETLIKMEKIAKRNTEIYREVFRCYPDDEIVNISSFEKFLKEAKNEKYEELKNEIVGHAVSFPLQFLKEENLKFNLTHKEYYVPNRNFT